MIMICLLPKPVGAMRTYLAKLFTGKIYFSLRETLKLITSAFSKRFSAKAGKAEDFFDQQLQAVLYLVH